MQPSPRLSPWYRNIVVYMSLSSITTSTSSNWSKSQVRWRERKRERHRETMCVCLQSVSSLRGPKIQKKQDVCVCVCKCVRVFCKNMFIRKCRHRQRPPPQCFRWWRRWRSRARWRRWTLTATHPAGRVPRQPRQRRGRWPTSWRVSARHCSHHWERSPWRLPSLLGSRRESEEFTSGTSHICRRECEDRSEIFHTRCFIKLLLFQSMASRAVSTIEDTES